MAAGVIYEPILNRHRLIYGIYPVVMDVNDRLRVINFVVEHIDNQGLPENINIGFLSVSFIMFDEITTQIEDHMASQIFLDSILRTVRAEICFN